MACIAGGVFAVGIWCLMDVAHKWNDLKAAIGIFCFSLGLCGTIYVSKQEARAETAIKMLRGDYSVEYTSSNDTIITLK